MVFLIISFYADIFRRSVINSDIFFVLWIWEWMWELYFVWISKISKLELSLIFVRIFLVIQPVPELISRMLMSLLKLISVNIFFTKKDQLGVIEPCSKIRSLISL